MKFAIIEQYTLWSGEDRITTAGSIDGFLWHIHTTDLPNLWIKHVICYSDGTYLNENLEINDVIKDTY